MQKIPYPVAATIDPHEWWHNPSTARVLFSEYVKFIAVWLRTQLEDDPEGSLGGRDHERRSPDPARSVDRRAGSGARPESVQNGFDWLRMRGAEHEAPLFLCRESC